MIIRYFLFLFICTEHTLIFGDILEDVLTAYETVDLSQVTFQHRSKRDLSGEQTITINTKHRKFNIRVHKNENILAPNFKIQVLGQSGVLQDYEYDNQQLTGILEDESRESSVQAYVEDGMITATITTVEDIYFFEPKWRHINATSDNKETLFYKASDMKDTNSTDRAERHPLFQDYIDPMKEYNLTANDFTLPYNQQGQKTRQKRGAMDYHNSCELYLVADYKFFKNMGDANVAKTTNYLIGLIDRIDTIFRKTNFNGFSDMGFQIKDILVHNAPGPTPHHAYNTPDSLDTKELLSRFSSNRRLQSYCLGHLFTYHGFEGGVLGLAYIANPKMYAIGGVCSLAYGPSSYLNTGWSSSLNRYDRRLLTREADLVTTHEFGHNWGSEHDADTSECSPSSRYGGKYIMYTYSVSGYEPNNRIFSPCSKKAIGKVLNSKSYGCFKARSITYCGNMKRETNEQCDGGEDMIKGADKCCRKGCKLHSNAQCSYANDACCNNECQFHNTTHVCRDADKDACTVTSYCTSNGKCPQPKNALDNVPCQILGKCSKGKCLSICETKNMISCICDKVEDSCKWCCKANQNDKCIPLKDLENPLLPRGTPCLVGYCDKEGICQKRVIDMIERIWKIVDNLNPSTFWMIMRTNIVGTVIIISLIVWIPGALLVTASDRKVSRRIKEEEQWKTMNKFINEKNNIKMVSRSYTRREPHRVFPQSHRGQGEMY